MSVISTPITELFKIKHPILLAGVCTVYRSQACFRNLSHTKNASLTLYSRMNVAAGPELAAAVTNAGGLGVIEGTSYTPEILRQQVMSHLFLLTGLLIHRCDHDT
jgi:hypothetical protein